MEPNEDRKPVVGWPRSEDEGADPGVAEQDARRRGLLRNRNGVSFGGFLVFELVCWGGVLLLIVVAAAA